MDHSTTTEPGIAARHETEAALRDAAALNTLVLNSSRDCIVVLDLTGTTLFVSPGGMEAMEIADGGGVIGTSWLQTWSVERPAAEAALAEARAGRPGRFRGFCPTHRGRPKWWDVLVAPLAGADGTPNRLVSISRDVTQEVLAQDRLTISEESLHLALDAADVGTWDLDPRTNVLAWTDRTKAMFGIAPGTPCTMADFYGGLHPLDYDATAAAFASALDPQRRATYDVEYRTIGQQDGRIRWVAAKGRGVFDAEGVCIRAIGTAIDITARREGLSRQAFRLWLWDRLQTLQQPRDIMACASEALCRHLGVNRVGYGLVQPDGETITRDVNFADGVEMLSGTRLLTDFGAGSLATQAAGITILFEDVRQQPPDTHATWRALQVGAAVVASLVREGRLRAVFYVNNATPRAWEAGEVALIEDVAQRTWDAVERARAEAALRDANEMLEQRVAAALEERRAIEETLRQSQKMEAVGQLTGGLAHDFNNLLTTVGGSLELIQSRIAQGRTDELARYVTAAQAAAQRAGALTHRLLAFSRQQTLDPKPTDVNRLIAGMEDLIRRSVGPAVQTDFVGAAGLWTSLVDPPQLENALLNLCINARDAMPGGGQLTIETANRWFDERAAEECDLTPGPYLSLTVTDTGTGMTPEVAKRAFDPFYTTKPLGQGTGLGLSMIYGFARQSGGQVRIASEVGHGTTMCVYLPRFDGTAVEAVGPAEAADRRQASLARTVLVIDDEPTIRMLTLEVLDELGYTAIEAVDGPAGLRILQTATPIDVLITDVGLPGGMNGRQVADAARLLRPDLKILFITGYAENAALGTGQLEPGMQVLTKPFSLDALAARIKELTAA